MGEGAWLVAFLIAQRLVELGLAKWNTMKLRAAGGVEFGAAHYPLMVALHAFWLLGLWMFGHGQSVNPVWLGFFIALQAARVGLGDRQPWAMLDYPGDYRAGGRAHFARALSLAAASQLRGCRCRNRGSSTGT